MVHGDLLIEFYNQNVMKSKLIMRISLNTAFEEN